MKTHMRMWAGLLAAAGMAGGAAAEGVVAPGCAAPPACQAPGMEQPQQNPQQGNPSPEQGAGESALSGESGARSGLFGGNLTSTGAGLSASSGVTTAGLPGAPGGRVISGITTTTSQTPLILPGLFTAANAESARPMDRLFLSYSYFDRFRVGGPAGVQPGFNLNRYDIGAEKTLFDGRASIYVRAPYLEATNNSANAAIDGFGDVSGGFKFALFADPETGSALSAGFSVAAPTARRLVVNNNQFQFGNLGTPALDPNDPNNAPVKLPGVNAPAQTTTLDPTFLQPWVGGVAVFDRLFVQNYLGLVIPTDDRVATFFNDDIGVGYQLYRACPDRLLSSVTLTCDAQLLIPINHQGTPTGAANVSTFTNPTDPNTGNATLVVQSPTANAFAPVSVNLPDQVFVTPGLEFGLGERAMFSTGVVVPVAGPRAFSLGATVGFNFFY